MTAQHTPGPWLANRRYVETKDQTICEVFGGNREDARLIAAAPEMLEALEFIAGQGMSMYGSYAYMIEKLQDTARAAIAKATGGAA
jgi:hypothetical protein